MQIKGILGALLLVASATATVFRGIGKTETADAIDACAQAAPDVAQAVANLVGGILLYKAIPGSK